MVAGSKGATVVVVVVVVLVVVVVEVLELVGLDSVGSDVDVTASAVVSGSADVRAGSLFEHALARSAPRTTSSNRRRMGQR
jgi:uncharacterized membrane protein YcjF (UPF0283 family)